MKRLASLAAAGLLLAALLFGWRQIPYGEVAARRGAEALIAILENRFKRPEIADWSAIKGLVVLGGAPSRFEEALRLAAAHPDLRVVVSGPADYEMGLIAKAGLASEPRIVIERKSSSTQNGTYGNAVFSKEAAQPAPGERWLLVTSASHMPRAIGTFHKAGFAVEPWPVPDRTGDLNGLIFVACHEWLGLIAYRLLGRTDALLPASRPG